MCGDYLAGLRAHLRLWPYIESANSQHGGKCKCFSSQVQLQECRHGWWSAACNVSCQAMWWRGLRAKELRVCERWYDSDGLWDSSWVRRTSEDEDWWMPDGVSWKGRRWWSEWKGCLHSFGRSSRCDHGSELLMSVEENRGDQRWRPRCRRIASVLVTKKQGRNDVGESDQHSFRWF